MCSLHHIETMFHKSIKKAFFVNIIVNIIDNIIENILEILDKAKDRWRLLLKEILQINKLKPQSNVQRARNFSA